jgi:hypothetical protein
VIFEWYRGSDSSGEIPKRYAFLRQDPYKLFSPEKRVEALLELCRLEQDANYKALFLYELAMALGKLDRDEEMSAKLWEAFETFDLLGASFPHVAEAYAQVAWLLAMEWLERGEPMEELERYVPAMFAALVWWDRASIKRWDLMGCWYGLGRFFLVSAQKHADRTFGELALLCALRLHREATEDPKALLFLFECYLFLEDRRRCEKVLAMLREVDTEREYLPQAEAMGMPAEGPS